MLLLLLVRNHPKSALAMPRRFAITSCVYCEMSFARLGRMPRQKMERKRRSMLAMSLSLKRRATGFLAFRGECNQTGNSDRTERECSIAPHLEEAS